jgi:hypothetical protein
MSGSGARGVIFPARGAGGTSVVTGWFVFFHSGRPPSRSDAFAPRPAYCSVKIARVEGETQSLP